MTIRISKTKLMIMAICLLLVLNLSIFTTMAWMTDTAEVVNTFTVGKVDITLEETDVDNDGKKDRNEYHLIPGKEYIKDPTMTILARSEESYVRMILTVHNASAVKEIIKDRELGDFFAFIGGWDKELWKLEKTTEDPNSNTLEFEFRYKEPVSGFDADGKGTDFVLPALFTKLTVPGELKLEDLAKLEEGGFKMVIEAHAIQAAGFIDAKDANGDMVKPDDAEDAAWAAFVKEEEE